MYISPCCITALGSALFELGSVVAIQSHFDRYRALAQGLTYVIAYSAILFWRALVEIIMVQYDTPGLFFIFGGIILHGCVFGALLRPTSISTQRQHLPGSANGPITFKFKLNILRNLYFLGFVLGAH